MVGAAFVSAQALLARGEGTTKGTVRGIDPDKEGAVTGPTPPPTPRCSNNWCPAKFRVVLEQSWPRSLGARVGDAITLIAPAGQVTPQAWCHASKQMTVAGTFDSGPLRTRLGPGHAAPRRRPAHLPPGRPHGRAPEAQRTCTRPAGWRSGWRSLSGDLLIRDWTQQTAPGLPPCSSKNA